MDDVSGAVAGAAVKSAFKPQPSTAILKSGWQGIAEIALRVVCLVLLFILFICCCAALGMLNSFSIRAQFPGPPGWLLFVTLVAGATEAGMLAIRFLNFGFVTSFAFIVFIVDLVISFGTAFATFCGAVPAAVYAGQLAGFPMFSGVSGSMGAVAAFGFFIMFAFIGLGVFMILSFVLRWPNAFSKYSGSIGGSSSEE